MYITVYEFEALETRVPAVSRDTSLYALRHRLLQPIKYISIYSLPRVLNCWNNMPFNSLVVALHRKDLGM